jgi:hypothetical protein
MIKSLPAKGGFFPPRAPLPGVDSPYQGEMSRRDKRGRDAVSRRLTERFYQICRNLSVTAPPSHLPWKGRLFSAPKKIPKIGWLNSDKELIHLSTVS